MAMQHFPHETANGGKGLLNLTPFCCLNWWHCNIMTDMMTW
jgi:hypothetical protein